MKSKQLQKFALAAEIVSAAAIIVTLAFLVIEMRANTAAIQDQTYQELTQQLNNYRTNVMESDYPHILDKLLTEGWENLDRVERLKIMMLRHNLYAIYEMAFYSRKRDVIGADEWTRFEKSVCNAYQSDVDRGVWGNSFESGGIELLENLTPEFGQYILDTC
jgi:hypothetical protein